MVKPSERLGNYEVATAADGSALELGSGAGGVTYRGRHIHLGTEVAIKLLIRRKNLLQKDRDAFLSEARAAASLSHPQIARILDFGESAQQHPYYVMELCEGGSLEEFGRKAGPPDGYACIQWFHESAAALAHAHQKGILHRDIKPSNLLVARQNENASVKLIDFGLANHADQTDSPDHVIGTPHFAAPEQLRGQAEPASDVFSLGATFLWLMTGKHLSQGDVKSVIADRLEATSYAAHLASLPVTWQNLLGRMIDVDPRLRPRNGGEVLAELQRAFPNHPGHPVAWDSSAEFPDAGCKAPAPSRWEDFPDEAWADRWTETGTPSATGHGVSLRANRPGGSEPCDVSRFTNLSPEIAAALVEQADRVASHSEELGLGEVILERGTGWWSVAWPALGPQDALSWVRQGQSATPAEILAAMDPIAFALDGMMSGGFEHLEIHPSMLIVSGGPPLKFSLAVPLPVLESGEQAADSAGTIRGAMGAGLAARFASCIYQLLSGRTLPPAAFVNARAYQAIPRLTERSNRFLSSAIAGTLASGTCRDVIRGLVHEERIPGASYSGTLASGTSIGSRTSSDWRSIPAPPSAEAPVRQEPAPAPPPVPQPAPDPVAPPPVEAPPPPRVQPLRTQAMEKKPPIAAILTGMAAVGILAAGSAAWFLFPKSKPTDAPKPALPSGNQVSNDPDRTPAPPPPDPAEPQSIVRVPGDAPSITEAIQLCKSGGTIELSGGTHNKPIILTKSVSIISKSAAVFEDTGIGSSLVTARGPIQVILRNIQIKNTQRQAGTEISSSPSLVLLADGASVRFEGCVVEGSVGNGISLADKASANFSNSRIRKNRGYGITVSSGSKVDISLSEIQQSGRSGIAATNVGSVVTLGSGASVSTNSQNGVEIANGAELRSSGAEINGNQKVGLTVDGSGSQASLESSCVISGNRRYGAGITNSGRLVLTDGTVEDNSENGIYVESGGQAEITSSRFKTNGTIGVYLVGGAASAVTISKSSFEHHSDAGVAFVEGVGKVSGSTFTSNPMAIFFGNGSSGSATGNTFRPGPVEDKLVIENAGAVTLGDNQAEE